MHEFGIANSVLEAVKTEVARRAPGAHLHKVGLRIGELAAIDQDALRFCFEAITRETEFESLQLEIEFCPRRHRCRNCGREFVVRDFDFRCPQCANPETECIGGDELELAFLEVEENGACAAATKGIE
jgi:hydrogenase nickel incorporation protein HypA/HybF